MDFIDLIGASGASYRFRARTTDDAQLPVAGNYAVVSRPADGAEVHVVGMTNDLSRLATEAGGPAKGAQVFTRLDVARVDREAVHADLVAAHPAARVEVDTI